MLENGTIQDFLTFFRENWLLILVAVLGVEILVALVRTAVRRFRNSRKAAGETSTESTEQTAAAERAEAFDVAKDGEAEPVDASGVLEPSAVADAGTLDGAKDEVAGAVEAAEVPETAGDALPDTSDPADVEPAADAVTDTPEEAAAAFAYPRCEMPAGGTEAADTATGDADGTVADFLAANGASDAEGTPDAISIADIANIGAETTAFAGAAAVAADEVGDAGVTDFTAPCEAEEAAAAQGAETGAVPADLVVRVHPEAVLERLLGSTTEEKRLTSIEVCVERAHVVMHYATGEEASATVELAPEEIPDGAPAGEAPAADISPAGMSGEGISAADIPAGTFSNPAGFPAGAGLAMDIPTGAFSTAAGTSAEKFSTPVGFPAGAGPALEGAAAAREDMGARLSAIAADRAAMAEGDDGPAVGMTARPAPYAPNADRRPVHPFRDETGIAAPYASNGDMGPRLSAIAADLAAMDEGVDGAPAPVPVRDRHAPSAPAPGAATSPMPMTMAEVAQTYEKFPAAPGPDAGRAAAHNPRAQARPMDAALQDPPLMMTNDRPDTGAAAYGHPKFGPDNRDTSRSGRCYTEKELEKLIRE